MINGQKPNTDAALFVVMAALILAAIVVTMAIFVRNRPAVPDIAKVSIMAPEADRPHPKGWD